MSTRVLFLNLRTIPATRKRQGHRLLLRDKLSQRSVKTTTHRQRQGARNQPAYSKELQTARIRSSLEGYLEGKGQRQILELS